MPLTKSTLDQLNTFITSPTGALASGESDVISQINALNGGGEITFDRGNGDLTVWQTCVIPGTPDVLLVTDQSGNNRVTYVRR